MRDLFHLYLRCMRCSIFEMFSIWDVFVVQYLRCSLFEMYLLFSIWDVQKFLDILILKSPKGVSCTTFLSNYSHQRTHISCFFSPKLFLTASMMAKMRWRLSQMLSAIRMLLKQFRISLLHFATISYHRIFEYEIVEYMKVWTLSGKWSI